MGSFIFGKYLPCTIFEGSFHPVVAFHLGILTWLTLQGVMMVYLFHDFESLACTYRFNLGFMRPQVLLLEMHSLKM